MFANPVALIALGLLALPVLIHMLARLSGRKVLFPTIRFLRPSENQRLALEKIKQWPLLIVRLLAMGLLIFAISGPIMISANRPRAAVILIDSSLSMNSQAVKEGAANIARESLSSFASEDTIAVAQFDNSVKPLCDFTKDRAALANAISSFSPRYGEADFEEALKWANRMLAGKGQSRRLILISDLQTSNITRLQPITLDGVELEILRVNNPHRANARIDSIAMRATREALEFDSTALFDDGKSVLAEPVSLKLARTGASANAVDSRATLTAEKTGDDLIAGVITANRADDFDADDSRFFVARVAAPAKVMIIQPRLTGSTDQATFIEKAIEANAQENSAASLSEKKDALPANADALPDIRAIIAPVESLSKTNIAPVREQARKGGFVILTVNAGTDPARAIATLKDLDERFATLALDSISSTDALSLMPPLPPSESFADEPLLDAESAPALASIRFNSPRTVHLAGAETLMKYSNNEPAVVRLPAGAGDVVLLGFGLSDKDTSLVRSPIFPAFIEWLTGRTGPYQRKANLTIGQAPAARLLGEVTRLTKLYPGNERTRDEAISNYEAALAEPGVYEAERSTGKLVFALNTPAAESSMAQSSEQELSERITINRVEPSKSQFVKARAVEASGLWKIVAIGAFAVSLIEMVLSARRKRRSPEP